MATLDLTNEEIKSLYELVSRQRSRYRFLKSQFDIDAFPADTEVLGNLLEKLEDAKAE